MAKIRCKPCVGSGKVMGGGMMMHDCDECDGTGKVEVKVNHYQEAIDKIKEADPSLTPETAQKFLDDELEKIDAKESHDGKRKEIGKNRK